MEQEERSEEPEERDELDDLDVAQQQAEDVRGGGRRRNHGRRAGLDP